MAYNLADNAKCSNLPRRDKWSCLGRTSASQSSHAIDEFGNAFGWGQGHYGQAGTGDPEHLGGSNYNKPKLLDIELATKISVPGEVVKICSGELASAAINKAGEIYGWGYAEGTAGNNCASFALPNDSGKNTRYWDIGPVADSDAIFFLPTRIAPGYTFKDIAFDYYHAVAIGTDSKLYTWGYDDDSGSLGLGAAVTSINTPTVNPTLTSDIKLIDCELLVNAAVTVDDKVYVWGDDNWWYIPQFESYVPIEVTGLVIPSGETITYVSVCLMGVMVVLSNGEVWAAGDGFMYGDGGVFGDSPTFRQLTCFTNPIVLAKITALGAEGVVVIDDEGDIYGWSWGGDEFVGNSESPSPIDREPNLCAADYAGQRKYIDVIFNNHQIAFQAIDEDGWLYTWGYQSWGPHLATNTIGTVGGLSLDPNVDGIVYRAPIASKANPAVDAGGVETYLNRVEQPASEYILPVGQDLRHRPCGHWHLRLFEEWGETYPPNCWMPTLAMDGGILLFVAAGQRLQSIEGWEGTGNEILAFLYDTGSDTWTNIMWDDMKFTASYPGGAAIDGDARIFMNYKYDVAGPRYQEVYSNPAMGVWALNGTTLNYTEFNSVVDLSGENKVGAYSTGLMAIAYEDAAGQLLVQVSTDFGATWNLKKTVAVDADRKCYSLVIDKTTGYIFLAHQTTSSQVRIERTIDGGANWTTQSDNTLITGLLELKLVSDGSMLFLFGHDGTDGAIERSSNDGVNWYTINYEPAPTIKADGCNVADEYLDIGFIMVSDGFYWYDYEAGIYQWLAGEISDYIIENSTIEVESSGGADSSVAGSGGRFAYSSYNFYTLPDPRLAVLISVDKGENWSVRASPLSYQFEGEVGKFTGDPLFYLVKQRDKY